MGIICDLLSIDRVYRDLSFIIWKGKSGSNSPKKLYEGVLQFLIDENLLGLIDSEYCVNILANEIEKSL